MSTRIDRRQAPGAFGTISSGGQLAACGKDSADGGTASVATTAGRDASTCEPIQGRTTHIRARVHLDNATVLTTQLFDDDLSSKVYEDAAHAGRGRRDQRNSSDAIFDASLLMTTRPTTAATSAS